MKKLVINHLNKNFGRHQVLADINLEFDNPGIYGLLGPNGAGKSTLMEIITDGLLTKSGQITIDGQPVHDEDVQLQKMWLMNAYMPFTKWTSINSAMKLIDSVRGNFDFQNAQRMLKEFDIDPQSRISQLSTGQQTSVKLVLALNVSADVVMLDEPVLGLDANHREIFYSDLLKAYSDRPRIFIIATHLISEITQLIDHVIILNHQHIQLVGSTESVLDRAYVVSGQLKQVDEFTQGMNVLTMKPAIAGTKSAVVFDQGPASRKVPQGLDVRHLDLQSLFVALTSATVPDKQAKVQKGAPDHE